MDKKGTKVPDKREMQFVASMAKAIATVNGHSHPEEWAAAVSDAYASPEDASDLSSSISEARTDEAAKREE